MKFPAFPSLRLPSSSAAEGTSTCYSLLATCYLVRATHDAACFSHRRESCATLTGKQRRELPRRCLPLSDVGLLRPSHRSVLGAYHTSASHVQFMAVGARTSLCTVSAFEWLPCCWRSGAATCRVWNLPTVSRVCQLRRPHYQIFSRQ